MQKQLVEFVGTFLFMLVFVMARNAAGTFAPFAIGGVFTAMVLAGGSGSSYNPAISVANLMLGRLEKPDFPAQILMQILGAVLGSLVAAFLLGCSQVGEIAAHTNDPICALVAEFFGTFALVWVALGTATGRSESHHFQYSLAVGFTILAGTAAFSGVSSGAFSPAVAAGMATVGMVSWSDIWIYLAGNVLGAAAAAAIFQTIHPRTS